MSGITDRLEDMLAKPGFRSFPLRPLFVVTVTARGEPLLDPPHVDSAATAYRN
jgi:hypothetical protein